MCNLCHISPGVIHAFPFQLAMPEEKAALVAATDSQREPFEVLWTPEFESLILDTGLRAASEMENQGNPDTALGIMRRMDEPLEELYASLFGDVIPHFAAGTFGALKSYLPPLRKEDDVWLQAVLRYIQEHVPRLGRLATDTAWNEVSALLELGKRERLTIPQMAKRLTEAWPDIARSQATRIVRTETVASSNYGSLSGAKATGLPMEKEWIAAFGDRTRETHAAADGQRVPIDQPFVVGGEDAMYPGDANLSAAERLNCRCTQGYHVIGA